MCARFSTVCVSVSLYIELNSEPLQASVCMLMLFPRSCLFVATENQNYIEIIIPKYFRVTGEQLFKVEFNILHRILN